MTQEIPQCPCGSGTPLAQCCAPFIDSKTRPTTPEQLMRSRFSAFSLGKANYLLHSTHASARDIDCLAEIQQTIANVTWRSLLVISATQQTKTRGFVEFVAFFQPNHPSQVSEVEQLHELSSFILDNGRWSYLEGERLKPYPLGRNDPCWCGGGKKFKKCHNSFRLA